MAEERGAEELGTDLARGDYRRSRDEIQPIDEPRDTADFRFGNIQHVLSRLMYPILDAAAPEAKAP